jgi:transcriptional regulator with XRE-family HTH domain
MARQKQSARGIVVRGSAVQSFRHARGLTQEELAKLANLDVKTVRNAEQGKRLDADTLQRLAKALEAELATLVEPTEDAGSRQEKWRQLVLDWQRLFDEHDIEGLMALYHNDAVLSLPGGENIPFGGIYRGKAEVRKAHEIAWQQTRQQPIELADVTILVSDAGVTLSGAKGVYLPDGRLVRFPSLQMFTFADDLIREHQVQFDTLEFFKHFRPEQRPTEVDDSSRPS